MENLTDKLMGVKTLIEQGNTTGAMKALDDMIAECGQAETPSATEATADQYTEGSTSA